MSLTILDASHKWNHTVLVLRLAYFTWQTVFQVLMTKENTGAEAGITTEITYDQAA